jgi:N-acetylneuraminic acid mutarotase
MNKNILLLVLLILGKIHLVRSQDSWTQKADYGGTARSFAVGFNIDGKGYLGTGDDDGATNGSGKAFWKYDPITNIWTQMANFGGSKRESAVGFSVGNFGYLGTGVGGLMGELLSDFWQYDPTSNTWTQKADLPSAPRKWASGFSIGDKGYLGFGDAGFNGLRKDFYEYDPATDTWTEKAQLGGKGRSTAGAFSIGGKGYVLGGAATPSDEPSRDLWEYDPVTNQWTEKASFPGAGRTSPVGFAMQGKGYYGTGHYHLEDFEVVVLSDFWEYDPVSDLWLEKASLEGAPRYRAVGFAISNKAYIGTGLSYDSICNCTETLKDFWEYTSDCLEPSGLATTNIKATSVKLSWSVEATAQTYSVRYRKTGTLQWSKTSALSNLKKLTGLMHDTEYEWGVKSICDAASNVSSDWSATQTFTTKPLRIEGQEKETITFSVFPNPVSSSATISFSTEVISRISIELLDVAGIKNSLLDASVEAGTHNLSFDRSGLGNGIYFLRLIMEDQTTVVKLAVE